ncbi:MAG: hypothetical protein K6T86_08675 [Pirellulales bacterium]|nr:hypothetical protein [Pirellulales bacterium]
MTVAPVRPAAPGASGVVEPATAPGPFGAPILRKEDRRLAAGDGRYLDDLGHEALAAAFLRSPHAHARIVDIDIDAALDVEGVVAIYTYEDLDGRMAEPLPLLIPHPALHAPRTAYPLAKDVVRHAPQAATRTAGHAVSSNRYRCLGEHTLDFPPQPLPVPATGVAAWIGKYVYIVRRGEECSGTLRRQLADPRRATLSRRLRREPLAGCRLRPDPV